MDDSKKTDALEQAARAVLEDGDSYIVTREDGECSVTEFEPDDTPSVLRTTQPELYGQLLRLNERIDSSAGCFTLIIFPILLGGLCYAIEQRIIDFGIAPEVTDDFGKLPYILALIVGIWLGLSINSIFERRAYQQERGEIVDACRRLRLSRDQLVAQLAGDDSVSSVAGAIKLDRSPEWESLT